MVQVPHASVYLGDLKEKINERSAGSLSEFVRESVRMRLEIEDAAEAAGMADVDDDWWRDWLYDAAREELAERREREAAEAQEGEELEA